MSDPTDERQWFASGDWIGAPVPSSGSLGPAECEPITQCRTAQQATEIVRDHNALAAALSSARAENERLTEERDGWRDFTGAIGYGDNRSEPQIEPSQLLDVWREVTGLAEEHTAVCPEWCDGCMQWEKPYSCERCHGSGCDAATALGAYSPCKDCDGERRNHESWNPTGQPTAAESDLADVRAENAALHESLNVTAERAAVDRRALDEAQAKVAAVAALCNDADASREELFGHGRGPALLTTEQIRAALAAAQPTESAPR